MPISNGRDKNARQSRWTPFLMAALTLAAYSGSFQAPFILDDKLIMNSPGINRLFPLEFRSRMLVDFSFRLQAAFGMINPADARAVNILMHLASGILLFYFLRITFRRMRPALPGDAGPGAAAAISALWLLHPLNTQAVTYVCQRYESMMGTFFIMTCFFFALSLDSKRPHIPANLSLAACALGMLSKEVMAAAPPMLALYDLVFSGDKPSVVFRKRWKFHLATHLTMIILALALAGSMARNITGNITVAAGTTFPQHLANQAPAILGYLRLIIIPRGLCFDHGLDISSSIAQLLPSIAVVAAMLGLSLLYLARLRPPGFAGAWFFLILIPSSAVVPLNDIFVEHRVYLPSIAVISVIVISAQAMLHRINQRFRPKALAAASITTALICLALAAATYSRNMVYRSQESIWRDVIAKRPGNLRAWISLSAGLLEDARYNECIQTCLKLLDRITTDRARLEIEHARIPANIHKMRLGRILAAETGAHNNIGLALHATGRFSEAAGHFRQATVISPSDTRARHNLAVSLLRLGHTTDAITILQDLLAGNPSDQWAHSSLGDAFIAAGNDVSALNHYDRALALSGQAAPVAQRVAILLATSDNPMARNPARALTLALHACNETDWASFNALEALAAAYNATGEQQKAREAVARAIAIVNSNNDIGESEKNDRRTRIRNRVQPYGNPP